MASRDFGAAYAAKRMGAAEAVAMLHSGAHLSMGMALGEPPALLRALAQRLERAELEDLKLWYFHSMPEAAETVLRYDLMDRVRPHCMFMGAIERDLQRRGEAEGKKVLNFVPVAFSDAPRLLRQHVPLDACLTTVSPMDKHGYFSLGANSDYIAAATSAAKKTIVEVNANLPRAHGAALLHVSDVAAIVENTRPLHETPARRPSAEEERISEIIAGMVPDGACLQMGIGALPNAVCAHLSDRKDLGVHTELLSPGLVALAKGGAVTNAKKRTYPGRTVYTFALGDKETYAFLDDNPAAFSLPVDLCNDPRHIAKNPGVVSINATIEVDLAGACNSENLGGRQYSGSGGQLDFVRGARASSGGRSIIACASTAKGGAVSKITPFLQGPVTTPRNDVDTIVTEFGAVRLIGLSGEERARALIEIAHPDHRAALFDAAKKAYLV